MWIFGYGSLVWKADFEYEEKRIGCVHGYVRRFWQASTDHRGVPGAPGRVVTLIPHALYTSNYPDEHVTFESDVVWGMAYRIHSDNIEEVCEYLDYREKNGYTIDHVKVKCIDGTVLDNVLVYVGTHTNPEFLGPAPLSDIALQIRHAIGPSGPNIDYLMNLIKALETFPTPALDHHLKSLLEKLS